MKILTDLWNLFFPRYCVACGRLLGKNEECLCMHCFVSLPRMSWEKDGEMEKTFWGRFPIERAAAYLNYAKGGDVSSLLYSMKYYGNEQLAIYLGKCMAEEFSSQSFFDGVDCLVPIPLHADRLRQRGYNQSEALAKGIASVTGLPVHVEMLRRIHPTETQTQKGRYERWLNVKDGFSVEKEYDFRHKHVLLVDDVLTTGATMTACADVLKDIEGIRISILALAVAGG